MKGLAGKIALFGALFFAVAAVALLPALAPPKAGAVRESTSENLEYDASFTAIVQGSCVGRPGAYRLPYGCTYGELFALAAVSAPPAEYAADAPVSFADAVLIGGEYYIYLVL
ncbi:MAG TPA: hypothetical protein H9731_01565 [Candidatus Borkfalkia excrementipullorum]|mgnify:FL=1|nr:hypothetical protein [Candidatus Borkfalkia excrementipullorum]